MSEFGILEVGWRLEEVAEAVSAAASACSDANLTAEDLLGSKPPGWSEKLAQLEAKLLTLEVPTIASAGLQAEWEAEDKENDHLADMADAQSY